jgi:hypothetical protein
MTGVTSEAGTAQPSGESEITFIFSSTRKWWPFNTGDCLIEVTAWAGLTVYKNINTLYKVGIKYQLIS